NEPCIRGGTLLRKNRKGVGTEVYFVLLKSVHRRLIPEDDQLAVALGARLEPKRDLGQLGTNVLTFLVDNTSATSPTDDQPTLLDLREKSDTITLLGKGLQLRIDFVPFLPLSLGLLKECVIFLLGDRPRAAAAH